MTPVTLSQLAVARVSGAEAGAFLHAQLTADVAALAAGDATFACYCSPRGQVLGLLLVGRTADSFMLAAHGGLMPGMLQRLRLYVLRARVELELLPEWVLYGLPDGAVPAEGAMDFRPSGADLYYRFGPPGAGSPEGLDRWRGQELGRNIVWLAPPTTERFIPQMLGLDGIGAVSFSKGCYPGQEVIARARYLGKVKRKPLCLRLDVALEVTAGNQVRLLDGEQWLEGTVVDGAVTHTGLGGGETVVFIVAPVPNSSPDTMEYEGRSYRCATM